MYRLPINKLFSILSDQSIAFLTVVALTLLLSGCSLMNVPSNLMNGLQKTDVAAATAAQEAAAVEELSPGVESENSTRSGKSYTAWKLQEN